MSESSFAALLDYLEREFQVVSLDGLLQGPPADGSKPVCVLTFDDGWSDNYTTAFPLLKKLAMPTTIFLSTGLIGKAKTFWVEQLIQAYKDPGRREHIRSRLTSLTGTGSSHESLLEIIRYLMHRPAAERNDLLAQILPPGTAVQEANGDRLMEWSQVREMSAAGIEFGAHTVTHPLLPYEDDATVAYELSAGKEKIEEVLGKKVRAFAYPNGSWDERVRRYVQQAGYTVAFTTDRGWHRPGHDPLTVRRVFLHEGSVSGLGGKFSPAVLQMTLAGF